MEEGLVRLSWKKPTRTQSCQTEKKKSRAGQLIQSVLSLLVRTPSIKLFPGILKIFKSKNQKNLDYMSKRTLIKISERFKLSDIAKRNAQYRHNIDKF